MLRSGRRVEKQLRKRRHGVIVGIKENTAHLIGNRASARFPGYGYASALVCKKLRQHLQLGGFAAPLYALEGYETGHYYDAPYMPDKNEIIWEARELINTKSRRCLPGKLAFPFSLTFHMNANSFTWFYAALNTMSITQ
jgi:hypothetical protein